MTSHETANPRLHHRALAPAALAMIGLSLGSFQAFGFDSGSTGADGAFSPTVNTRLQLPESGVFNFTSVNIPSGVTVTFGKNTTNTPVVILASGDVNVAGTISISGYGSSSVGSAGDGNIGDDGLPGKGGPGGYGGGVGGLPEGNYLGGDGLGPGGGGFGYYINGTRGHGGGGSFGGSGSGDTRYSANPGSTYGSSLLLPLIGGSGGGGGMGGNAFSGSGGGGGGGALLIASSGTLTVSGGIWASGGKAGQSSGGDCGATGGGGSGGGIRLVATNIAGNGTLSAMGGARAVIIACSTSGYSIATHSSAAHVGGDGRIRLEAETLTRSAATTPAYSFGPPGDLFIAGLPTLRISAVAGVAAPASPTGVADISLPADTPNPVTVEFEATGIPLGNIVKLTVVPASGSKASAVSNALDGDTNLSTALTTINLPQGPSTLMASITYTLVAGVDDARRAFFERIAGEPVQGLRIEAALGGEHGYVLITESGREVGISRAQMATAG